MTNLSDKYTTFLPVVAVASFISSVMISVAQYRATIRAFYKVACRKENISKAQKSMSSAGMYNLKIHFIHNYIRSLISSVLRIFGIHILHELVKTIAQ